MTSLLHRMRISLKWLMTVAPMLIATASTADDTLRPQTLTGSAAEQALASIKAPTKFDLSKISVLRLVVKDKPMEVTSLGPAILSGKPNEAFTAALFSEDRASVIFVSKDSSGRVSQLTISTKDLEPKRVFRIFLDAPGQPEHEVEATVSSFLTRP